VNWQDPPSPRMVHGFTSATSVAPTCQPCPACPTYRALVPPTNCWYRKNSALRFIPLCRPP